MVDTLKLFLCVFITHVHNNTNRGCFPGESLSFSWCLFPADTAASRKCQYTDTRMPHLPETSALK